ncbi:hypothetical protein CC78DRAFT_547306 [Lojkania enalia]|uniref:Uncharacterized protein n=1 Tax=Lojkania enalia TaxID=147567 RepID=A0A9P4K729_9PLEO|nr:hypothetical protein CC78DRAFT_547306 [Didymosphaeria enalia]
MSHIVVTYVYQRNTDALFDGDEDAQRRRLIKEAEGVGSGPTLPNSRTLTIDRSDDDRENEADEEEEEHQAIKEGIVLMIRSLALRDICFNIISKAGPIFQPVPKDRQQLHSQSMPHLDGVEDSDNSRPGLPPRSMLKTITGGLVDASLEQPEYSDNKILRTIEKKVDRNAKKKTLDSLAEDTSKFFGIANTKLKRAILKELKLKDMEAKGLNVLWDSNARV